MFCVRRCALKTGFVFVLNPVLLDVVARSNYQGEITVLFCFLFRLFVYVKRALASLFMDQGTVLSGALKKHHFCLKELSNVDCGLLINLSERCCNSWF